MIRLSVITLVLMISGCSFRHIGCLGLYEGSQVRLLQYVGKNYYIVCPEYDTTKKFIIDSRDLD